MSQSVVDGIDRLATKLLGGLHGLLGFSYSDKFEHYVYEATITFPVASSIGTQGTGSIRISQEAAFFCTAIRCNARYSVTGNVGTITSTDGVYAAAAGEGDAGWPDAPFLLQIQDGGNDRLLHSEASDAALIYGTHGNADSKLSRPKLFKPNANIQLTATLLKQATPGGWVSRIAFLGFKVYKTGGTDQTVRVQ